MTARPPASSASLSDGGPETGHAEPESGHAEAGRGSTPASQPTTRAVPLWQRWRLPLALIGFIVLGGIVIALISRLVPPHPNSYLDPASSAADGGHALADILGERGFQVAGTYSPASTLAELRLAAGSPGAGPAAGSRPAAATLIITSPDLLTPRQRTQLWRSRADLVLVEPGPASVATLAPSVLVAAHSAGTFGRYLPPRCALTAARLAGSANVGGLTYQVPARASGCYPLAGHWSLVRYGAAGRTITIIGSGAALTNDLLGANGNAALALNLLNAHRRVVWLTPEPAGLPAVGHPGGSPRAGPSLIPWAAWLLVIQLGVATMLVAIWRGRRLGPLISERLPVIVRASETVEGHARLYQSRRARDRAAAALREAMLARVLPALGLVIGSPEGAVTAAIAGRSRLGQQDISGIVYGPVPATDAELVRLARSLDELERQVRSQ